MELKIKKLARSRKNLLIAMIINVIIGIILCILSGAQSVEINEAGTAAIFDASLGGWQHHVCNNKIVGGILSPFAFNFRISLFNADVGRMGCPWRIRNTVYRLLCVCLIVIITLYQIVVLIYKQKSKLWKILYWLQYILYLAMILVLVIDSDGIWNGYHACINNFDMQTGYGPILLNLLAVQWMTTQSPSWCLGAVGANVGVNIHQNFAITDGCFLTPFIYTAIADAALVIFTYISYKLARHYIFDDEYDYESDDDGMEDNVDYNNRSNTNTRTAKINTRRTMGAITTTSSAIGTRDYSNYNKNNNKSITKNKNKKASISFVEPAHWKSKPQRNSQYRTGSGKPALSPAYAVQNYQKSPTYIPSEPMRTHKESAVEPAHWNINRRPTYEQNYS